MKKMLKVVLALLAVALVGFFSSVSWALTDTDGDGMPDDWELTYQLNKRNANDAFMDADSDGVVNLFEYFLGTSPRDETSPVVVTVGRSLSADYRHLEDAILAADPGTLIKVQVGTHNVNYSTRERVEKKVYIQGGWNEAFTSRKTNPFLTRLSGGDQHAIIDVMIDAMAEPVIRQAFMFDGLTFEKGLAEYGVVNLLYYGAKAVASVAFTNCVIRDNQVTDDYGAVVQVQSLENFLIVNTIIAGNSGTGVYERGMDLGGISRVINSTITDNRYFGYRNGDSIRTLDILNSIIWGNFFWDLLVENANVRSDYSYIGSVQLQWPWLGSYISGSHDINADPEFTDPDQRNFTLKSGSPCINAGTREGAPRRDFQGQRRGKEVDIGADEYRGR